MKKPKLRPGEIYYPEEEMTDVIMMRDLSFDFPGMFQVSLKEIIEEIVQGIGKEAFTDYVKPEQYKDFLALVPLSDHSFDVIKDNCKIGTVNIAFNSVGAKAYFIAVTI